MKKSIILSLTLFSLSALAQYLPSSSVPPIDQPWSVAPEPQSKNKSGEYEIPKLRIKVFPHDLANDHLHGKRDIKTEVKLQGEKITFQGIDYTQLDLTHRFGKILVATNTGEFFEVSELILDAKKRIKILRKGNEDKSHSYNGKLRIWVRNNGLEIVNTIDLESYLRGVVPKESVPTWPLESLKAQALAARSYAYYHYRRGRGEPNWDVDDTARYQVYAGVSAATEKSDRAIAETLGEVLTHNGRVITAFFHAYSGGRTDSAKNIFGKHVAYCIGDDEIFTREELKAEIPQRNHWVVEWTTNPMEKAALMTILKRSSKTSSLFSEFTTADYNMDEVELNAEFDSVKTLKFTQDTNEVDLNFVKIRSAIGWSKFPAYHFRLEYDADDKAVFRGHGWGHHVGMSQWGAMMMAEKFGKTYSEILHHYYTDVEIKKLSDLKILKIDLHWFHESINHGTLFYF